MSERRQGLADFPVVGFVGAGTGMAWELSMYIPEFDDIAKTVSVNGLVH